jgi:hypothetical protein
VQNVNNDNFGTLISYLVPGATALLGLSIYVEPVRRLLIMPAQESPTIGGFLYVTASAIAVGMTVGALRWALIDQLHHYTGIRFPVLNFRKLSERVAAMNLLIEIHYRYYLYYANQLVATSFSYGCFRFKNPSSNLVWLDVAFCFLAVIFFMASRDTLRKYYSRLTQTLSASEPFV